MTRIFLKLILPRLWSIAQKKKSLKGNITSVTLPCWFPIFQLPRGMQSGHHQFYADQFPGAFNFSYIPFPDSFLQFLIGWFSEATNISSEIADVPSAHGGDNLQQLIIFIEMWPWDLAEYEGLYHPGSARPHRKDQVVVTQCRIFSTSSQGSPVKHLSHETNVLVWDLSCSTGFWGRLAAAQGFFWSFCEDSLFQSVLVGMLAKSSHAARKRETNLIDSVTVQLS